MNTTSGSNDNVPQFVVLTLEELSALANLAARAPQSEMERLGAHNLLLTALNDPARRNAASIAAAVLDSAQGQHEDGQEQGQSGQVDDQEDGLA